MIISKNGKIPDEKTLDKLYDQAWELRFRKKLKNVTRRKKYGRKRK